MTQLPNDVVAKGYQPHPTRHFQFEQVFTSLSNNFTGTEQEFITAGLAYEYIEISPSRRLVV